MFCTELNKSLIDFLRRLTTTFFHKFYSQISFLKFNPVIKVLNLFWGLTLLFQLSCIFLVIKNISLFFMIKDNFSTSKVFMVLTLYKGKEKFNTRVFILLFLYAVAGLARFVSQSLCAILSFDSFQVILCLSNLYVLQQ